MLETLKAVVDASCDARSAYASVYSQPLSFCVGSGSHGAAARARWAVSW